MSKSRNNNCHLQTCFGVSKQAKDKGIVTLFIELMLDISIIALQMSHHSTHIVLCIINTERTQMNNLTKLDQCYSNFMFVTIRTNRLLVFFKENHVYNDTRKATLEPRKPNPMFYDHFAC